MIHSQYDYKNDTQYDIDDKLRTKSNAFAIVGFFHICISMCAKAWKLARQG